MQTAELVVEQPSRKMVESAEKPSGIKTILFHVHNDDMLAERLDAALSIARTYGAHLHLLHVTPIEAYTVVDAFGTYVNAEVVGILEREAAELRSRLEKQLESEDVSWDYEEVTGSLMPHVVQRAALADLVLVGREPIGREFGGPAVTLLGDLLHSIRTPMLVLSDRKGQIDLFGPALIAWNGSYEAANAMRSAVPLLKLASAVRIVSVKEAEKDQFPSTEALEYLSRHGIHAELSVVAPGSRVDEQLLKEAAAGGAAYLVMGGYSHSRAGEFLFGGVTRSLLQSAPLPLLMAR
jgi:nucleotide-binding universal stress UspA family protein